MQCHHQTYYPTQLWICSLTSFSDLSLVISPAFFRPRGPLPTATANGCQVLLYDACPAHHVPGRHTTFLSPPEETFPKKPYTRVIMMQSTKSLTVLCIQDFPRIQPVSSFPHDIRSKPNTRNRGTISFSLLA